MISRRVAYNGSPTPGTNHSGGGDDWVHVTLNPDEIVRDWTMVSWDNLPYYLTDVSAMPVCGSGETFINDECCTSVNIFKGICCPPETCSLRSGKCVGEIDSFQERCIVFTNQGDCEGEGVSAFSDGICDWLDAGSGASERERSASGKEHGQGAKMVHDDGEASIQLSVALASCAVVAFLIAAGTGYCVYRRQHRKAGLHVLQQQQRVETNSEKADAADNTDVAELVEEGTAVRVIV